MSDNYKSYKRRWFVLVTVSLLNVSTNALWMSYPAVANVASEYFKKGINSIDLLGTISLYVGIPCCLIATFVYDYVGFKGGLLAGTLINFAGGLIRCLSTFPHLNNHMSLELQFVLSVFGQALAGVANCFAVSVPTMVSQNWFPESERLIATGLLSLSMPLGMVLGQGITPTFVKCTTDIPTMNIVWFVPTLITFIIAIISINSDYPDSPPSRSAKLAREKYDHDHKLSREDLVRKYLKNLKSVFTNKEFIVLFIVVGGAVGFVNAFFTQLSQLMCSRGYDNMFSGLCGSLLLGSGFVGALISGALVEKFGRIEDVAKLFFGIAVLLGIVNTQLLRKSDLDVAIAISFSLFGAFAFGVYPLGLELALEVTYPVDEAISTAMIFMSGQIQVEY